jgi:hypothetical protein
MKAASRGDELKWLIGLALAYCVASFIHFFHNAEYLGQYPNMPAWISRMQVYAAWLAITSVGATGLLLVRGRFAPAGFVLIAAYAALGFDGLAHYALAPISAHTLVMNLTIWLEVAAAAALLAVTLRCLYREGLRLGR